jgi:tetratricopeptide (TPR) repeat protein
MKLGGLILTAVLMAGAGVAAAQDLDSAFQGLKEAESKKDVAKVKKLGVEVLRLTHQMIAGASEGEDKAAAAQRVAYAREVQVRAEYALYATAIQASPAEAVDLLATLEEESPKSKYLDEGGYAAYYRALSQTGQAAKFVAIAEKAIANFPDNEELLLVLADTALNHKQNERALGYAQRLIAALGGRKGPALGRAYYIAGLVHYEQKRLLDADKELRAAVPLIQGNDLMLAYAYFHLGLANYQLATAMRDRRRMTEAAGFSDKAAAIKSPVADQAWRNAGVMRAEAAKLR